MKSNRVLKRQWMFYLFSKFVVARFPNFERQALENYPQRKRPGNVLNTPSSLSDPHQKYIRNSVLGFAWNHDSHILPGWSKFYIAGIGIFDLFRSCDFDLNPTTFIYELDS